MVGGRFIMVKKNLFRYSSVLMCVVLTAASLVG